MVKTARKVPLKQEGHDLDYWLKRSPIERLRLELRCSACTSVLTFLLENEDFREFRASLNSSGKNESPTQRD